MRHFASNQGLGGPAAGFPAADKDEASDILIKDKGAPQGNQAAVKADTQHPAAAHCDRPAHYRAHADYVFIVGKHGEYGMPQTGGSERQHERNRHRYAQYPSAQCERGGVLFHSGKMPYHNRPALRRRKREKE